jgi:putative redox protein
MSEKVIVRQNKHYQVEFWASDPREPESDEVEQIGGLHEVTPYGMMLVSIATCTAQVVLAFAQHHDIDLEDVTLELEYQRDYDQDCEDCEEIEEFQERITEQISFSGDLSSKEEEKLFRIAHQCPIQKIFEEGIEIQSSLLKQ